MSLAGSWDDMSDQDFEEFFDSFKIWKTA
jgi:hypothetical protein